MKIFQKLSYLAKAKERYLNYIKLMHMWKKNEKKPSCATFKEKVLKFTCQNKHNEVSKTMRENETVFDLRVALG